MSNPGITFDWKDEKSVDEQIAEIQQLIAENKRTLMWRVASRITITACGNAKRISAEDCRPAVVALAKSLVAPGTPLMNDAAFVFYCNAVRVEGVDVVPLRKELDSENPFRKYNAVLFLAWKTPPDPAAIPLLDEVLRANADAVHFAKARARYDDQIDPNA